jgi:hypothetical protein
VSAVAPRAPVTHSERDLSPFARLLVIAAIVAVALAAWTWPSANLAPRDVPVGVVGPVPPALAQSDAYDVHRYGSPREARDAIRDREVYGALAGRTAYVASGASPAIAAALRASAGPAEVVDLAPGTRTDPRIATLGSLALPLTIVGIVSGALAVFTAGRTRDRVLAVLAGAVVAGLLAALIVQTWLGALPGSWLGLAGAVAFAAAAIAAAVAGLGARLGPAGIGLGAGLMMLVANPWSALSSAPELLPEPAGILGQLFPPGAAGQLLRSVAYFDGAAAGFPLVVLAAWTLAGLALIAQQSS